MHFYHRLTLHVKGILITNNVKQNIAIIVNLFFDSFYKQTIERMFQLTGLTMLNKEGLPIELPSLQGMWVQALCKVCGYKLKGKDQRTLS